MNCSARLWSGVVERLPELETVLEVVEEDDLESCVSGLLDRLPGRFALAGLSLGGVVAMALVRRAPDRVTRLCLASTNPSAPTAAQRTAWAAQLEALQRGSGARDLQAELLPVLLGADASPEVAEVVLTMATEVGSRMLARQLRLQSTRVDERAGLRRVRVPTLVLAAADDALCPVSRHEEIHRLVPGSRLVVVEDAGHLSPLERPGRVADELRRWLA